MDLGFDKEELEGVDPWYDKILSYSFANDKVVPPLFRIAKAIEKIYTRQPKAVICLSEIRIWPSSHDKLLIDLFFSSISNSPGMPPDGTMIECDASDGIRVVTLFHLAMLFGWDMTLWLGSPKMQIDLGHHGVLEIYAACNTDQLSADFNDLSGGRVLEIRNLSLP